MNAHALVCDRIVDALQGLQGAGALPAGLDLGAVGVALPRHSGRGDFTSNAALVLAKAASLPARELAGRLAVRLQGDAEIERVDVAGAGFLNLHLAPPFWHGVLAEVLKAGAAFGRSSRAGGEPMVVWRLAAGLAGAPTLSHARAAVLADALAGVLDRAGFGVTRSCAADADGSLPRCGPVSLQRAGAPVHLSPREVVGEAGQDAVRFMLAYSQADAPIVLDLAEMLDQSRGNPAFRVQYAHARAKSVFRNVREVFPHLQEGSAAVVGSDLSLLADSREIELIRRLARFPSLLEEAARARQPYRLAVYLYDLAVCFDCHYILGNDLPHLRFMQPADGTLTAARLALVQAVAQVLDVGLALLGVLAPLEMR
jgi:arginyl-tRNA synthetase